MVHSFLYETSKFDVKEVRFIEEACDDAGEHQTLRKALFEDIDPNKAQHTTD